MALLGVRLGKSLGIAIVAAAIALFLLSVRTFRTACTPVPGNFPTTTIVRSGPYRFSRNPIYLAFSLFQLGIALWIDSAWILLTLVGANPNSYLPAGVKPLTAFVNA